MQLLHTLSHMPFVVGDTVYFCHSPGLAEYTTPREAVRDGDKQPPQIVHYQPWQLAKLEAGVVTPIPIGNNITSPRSVICNPVVVDGLLSYIQNGHLFCCPLDDTSTPETVKPRAFVGFHTAEETVWSDPKMGVFFVQKSGENPVAHNTFFDRIVRIVPSGELYVITGVKDGIYRSILHHLEMGTSDIMVNGEHIYKCCIAEDNQVIHAVKVGDDHELRYLHKDTYELC